MRIMKFHPKRIIISFCFLTFSLLIMIVMYTNSYPNQRKIYDLLQYRLREMMKYDKGSGCEMPKLDPFAPEFTKLDKEVEQIVCGGDDWVACHLSKCHPTNDILKKMRDLVCVYTDILNDGDEDYNRLGDPVSVFGNNSYSLRKSDYAKVSCSGVEIDSILGIKTSWQGFLAGYRPIQLLKEPPADSYNILFILIDSVSRNQFMRSVPLSYEVLTEELQAVVLNRYNIVGDGTPAALLPILTGYDELEIEDARTTLLNSRKIDLTPFIFSRLKNQGYRTAYFEEQPWVSTFHYRFNGFPTSPSDHYMRPFFMEEGPTVYAKHASDKKKYCVGGVSQMGFMLNHTSQLFDLPGKKYCLTFIATYSHDEIDQMPTMDEDLMHFLRKFNNEGKLKDTILFVMGDHGSRYAAQRATYQGKIEERLPFVSIVLPESFIRARPSAYEYLKKNSEVLTTPFDMYTTTLDALNLMQYRNDYSVPGADYERGLSIFNLIPEDRSCAEAGVMPHWCACTKWYPVSSSEGIYRKAAKELTEYINTLTEEKRSECAVRKLVSIKWVQRRSPNTNMLGFNAEHPRDSFIGKYMKNKHVKPDNEYIQAQIILSPGQAIYEGSMQYIVKDDYFLILESDISRINAFGDDPRCISRTHPHLSKYCYCNKT